jgi:hypothetical protein
MSKRRRRAVKLDDADTELATTPEPETGTQIYDAAARAERDRLVNDTAASRSAAISLADVRAAVLRAHTDTAHTIADLEAWRAEIDCTIAFLRARRS